jgi:GNAT superfamily N-acetyltransferase
MVRNRGEERFMIYFEKATEKDIPELTKIMKKAFDDEAIRFKENPKGGGPPGYDDGSFLMKWGFTGDSQNSPGSLFKILIETEKGETPVGAFIVFIGEKDGSLGNNTLGTIFVDPEWQDRGIGSQAVQYILATFPGKRWVLGTPEWATRNHHFYEKNGFIKIREVWDPELDKEKGGAYSYIYERVTKA